MLTGQPRTCEVQANETLSQRRRWRGRKKGEEDEGRNIWGGGERKKQLHGRSDIPELRLENCAADRKSIDSMIYGM